MDSPGLRMPGVPRQGCSALKAVDNAAGCMNCCFVPTLKLCGEVFLNLQRRLSGTDGQRLTREKDRHHRPRLTLRGKKKSITLLMMVALLSKISRTYKVCQVSELSDSPAVRGIWLGAGHMKVEDVPLYV